MKKPDDSRPDGRVAWIGRIVFAWALAIAVGLVWLQVVCYEDYHRLAIGQQIHNIAETPDRGAIRDRTDLALAVTERTQSAVVNPQKVSDAMLFAEAVGAPLNLTPAQVREVADEILRLKDIHARREKKLPLTKAERAESINQMVLARHISDEQIDRLRLLPFKCISIVRDARRHYPAGALAAHIVGTMGFVGDSKTPQGSVGVEKHFDNELRGKPSLVRALTDARQERYYTVTLREGTPGINLRLTIHHVIQEDAESAIAAAVKANDAESGFLVAMDPANGEILAMVSYPSFDPSVEAPTKEEATHRENLAISAPIEPGSVMKMITISSALDAGKVTTDARIYCEGGLWARPGRKPIHDLHRFGWLSVADVLVNSSNIGAAKVADILGPKLMLEYMEKFGVRELTGIELPGESQGIISPKEKRTAFSHEYFAFGHEVGMTSLQLARAVCVIANGGKLVEPTLVLEKEIVDPATGVTTNERPQRKEPVQIIRPETAIIVRQLMQRVVEVGTGRQAQVVGYTAGGKTGTAELINKATGEYLKHRNAASFMGFAPANNPRIVIVATIYNTTRMGGPAAGPVFSEVAHNALRVLNVPPDKLPAAPLLARHEAEPAPDLVARPRPESPADRHQLVGPHVPNFRGRSVADVVRTAADLGLQVSIVGEGRARQQWPEAGTILPEGRRILVEFARN